MAGALHSYHATVRWTGNTGDGTATYTSYSRNHEITITDKPVLPGSSDPRYRGDGSRHNPEDLLVSAAAACHMLWFLHLAAKDGVCVTDYVDRATGTLRVEGIGSGQFTEIVLRPKVTTRGEVADGVLDRLHDAASEHCYIARSVNFPVRVVPPSAS